MAIRAIGVALLLSILPIAGCGTVANLVGLLPEASGVSPFGGVRHDVGCIKKAANCEPGCKTHPDSQSEQYRQVAIRLFCAADLPFSLIGDVVTWPYTSAYTFINQPIPTPPVTQAQPILGPQVTQAPAILGPPVTQAPADVQPQTSPLETLPEPRKLP
jgi:hypothetical protein